MGHEVVFLFGAGASKGAENILPCEPPLGSDLYDKLAERYPNEWGHGSQLGRYSEGLRRDFEKAMFDEVVPHQPTLSILEWQQKMALYFSSFIIDSTGNDLYSQLLLFLLESSKIEKAIFASLNYDCIFEQAALRLGLRVDYSSGERRGGVIQVLKVHGSCNFITVDIKGQRPYLTNPNSFTECAIECIPPVELESILLSKFSRYDVYHYPVLSLYSLGKDTFVGGMRIQKIRYTWAECLSNACILAVIGVRPNEEDAHIWNPIRETRAKPLYIGSESGFQEWRKANSNFELIAETFREGFDGLISHLS